MIPEEYRNFKRKNIWKNKFSNSYHTSPAVPHHGTDPAPPTLAVLELQPHERRLEGLEGAKLEPPADDLDLDYHPTP